LELLEFPERLESLERTVPLEYRETQDPEVTPENRELPERLVHQDLMARRERLEKLEWPDHLVSQDNPEPLEFPVSLDPPETRDCKEIRATPVNVVLPERPDPLVPPAISAIPVCLVWMVPPEIVVSLDRVAPLALWV